MNSIRQTCGKLDHINRYYFRLHPLPVFIRANFPIALKSGLSEVEISRVSNVKFRLPILIAVIALPILNHSIGKLGNTRVKRIFYELQNGHVKYDYFLLSFSFSSHFFTNISYM